MDNKILQQVKEALAQALAQKKITQDLLNNLGPAVIETLRPILGEISQNSKLSKEELLKAISQIKIDVPKADIPQAQVEVKIPEIKVPEPKVTVNIPEIKVPQIPEIKIPIIKVPKPEVTVNVPPVKIPEIKMPKEMDIKGDVGLKGINLDNPLPVQLRDAKGKPLEFNFGGTGGGGGGSNNRGILEKIVNNTSVSLLSPENSTTTPLLAGATFTGTAVDLKDYVTVNIVIKASHASATDGFCIDFSNDGTNWDITECHTIPAATGEAHLSRAKGRYCRVRYTNGITNQTYFRLATVFKNTAVSMTYEQLSVDVDDTHDAALVRSVLAGKKPSGDYTNIQATTSGNLKVSIEESTPPSALLSGRKTVATSGTAEQLGTGALQVGVLVMALKTNTNNVFVGNSTVDKTTDKQTELEPGESYAFAVDNLSDIWVDVTTNGEGVSYAGS